MKKKETTFTVSIPVNKVLKISKFSSNPLSLFQLTPISSTHNFNTKQELFFKTYEAPLHSDPLQVLLKLMELGFLCMKHPKTR
jgi:hypothetical protein